MSRWKYILERVLWSIAAIGLTVLFVFAWQAKSVKKCTAIQIELTGNNTGFLFMDEKEILRLINEQGVRVGTPVGSINLSKLEKSLAATKWVAHTDIYFDNQQQLQVKIEQRVPIARVFTASGNSFYIDNTAQKLPLRQLSVMRLPVFTGFPSDQEKLSNPDSIMLSEILHFAMLVQQDSFFNAQIAQVNIAPNGDFEMVPTLGDHLVLIGSGEHLEDKLNRLYTFYKKVWVPSGVNAFGVLDLRFDHQVVALKKGMQPIQFTEGAMPILQLGTISDSTLIADTAKPATAIAVPAPTVKLNLDSTKSKVLIAKPSASKLATTKPATAKPVAPIKKSPAKAAPSKTLVKPIVKKTTPKSNNKANNKSLNKVKKTAKAEMPKKSASNNN
jgi:cell division protein FtsQ